MKRLSDYKGEEAIDLWMELLEPIIKITSDNQVANTFRTNVPIISKAQTIVKLHKKEAVEILTKIDPTPIDGLNLIIRLVDLLIEIEEHEELKSFFSVAETEGESSNSAMESTGASVI